MFYTRKYEIIYSISQLGNNKITVEATSETKAIQRFKDIMELSGVAVHNYFIREITYLK